VQPIRGVMDSARDGVVITGFALSQSDPMVVDCVLGEGDDPSIRLFYEPWEDWGRNRSRTGISRS
jgi:hypothetical protein